MTTFYDGYLPFDAYGRRRHHQFVPRPVLNQDLGPPESLAMEHSPVMEISASHFHRPVEHNTIERSPIEHS